MKPILVSVFTILCWVQLSQICLAQDSPCNQGRATPPRVDPRSEQLICMPEYARSTVHYNIQPLGDINHDGIDDWAVLTGSITLGGTLVIYHGKQGRLPDKSEYSCIVQTTEDSGLVQYIAHGDWDGDGNVDLCVSIYFNIDTSFGNVGGNTGIGRRAIFWGDSTGRFSILDTTRLPRDGGAPGMWGIISSGISTDMDGDGVQDLFMVSYGAKFRDGKLEPAPEMYLYRGHRGKRWGRNGTSALPDWQMWSLATTYHKYATLSVIDQDKDGALDIVIRNFANGSGTVKVSVIYGKYGGLPDTTEIQTVNLLIANGHSCLFSDVTGDGVPELLVHAGSEEQVKVFLGLKGQRLLEQYGAGNDSAQPGQQKWWGKPWAKIWLPHRMNDWWAGTTDAVLDLGDADLDGVNDIWVNCAPYLMVYSSGEFLDSLADAIVDVRPTGISNTSYERVEAVIKNIDGSNIPTIAIGTVSGTIFVRGTKAVPSSYGKYRVLPEGTGKPGIGVTQKEHRLQKAILEVVPNPANGEIVLRWMTGGKTDIIITDVNGKEVLRTMVIGSEYCFDTNGLPKGVYFASINNGNSIGRTKIIIY